MKALICEDAKGLIGDEAGEEEVEEKEEIMDFSDELKEVVTNNDLEKF